MRIFALLAALVFLSGSVVVHANTATRSYYEEWNFAELMRKHAKGVADPVPWVGWWWPYNENGIGDRGVDRNNMSPADKLDRAYGNGYWIAAWEHRNHGKGRGAADWWGHCNGWATAAIMEREPKSSKMLNGVEFKIRDLKGILAEYWLESGSDFIGTRVWNSGDTRSYAFWDVVPAQFHLAMTNIIGRNKKSVIADRYTGHEVWNHPLVAYEIYPVKKEDYLGPDPQYPNIHRVNVTADMWWVNDDVDPDDLTSAFRWREDDHFSKRKLKYELWLDAAPKFNSRGELVSSGDIILTNKGYGGTWKNGTSYEVLVDSHPDFIWIPTSYARSSGYKNPRLGDAWVHQNLKD